MRKTRNTKIRKPKKIIRILCEGDKSETNYFVGLFSSNPQNRQQYIFRAYKPKDNSPKGIVNAAKEEKRRAIEDKISPKDLFIWAVFDKDKHENIPEAYDIARANGINIAFSSICFEFWILLHYTKTMRAFRNCEELIRYIKNSHHPGYEKCSDHFQQLKTRIKNAVKNGEWIQKQVRVDLERGKRIYDLNPYTNVHELVSFLLNL